MADVNLKRSLVFPIFNMLSGIFWAIVFMIGDGNYLLLLAPLACTLMGGGLAVLLTVKKRLDTNEFFTPRMVFMIVSLIAFTVPAFLFVIGVPSAGDLFDFLVFASILVFIIELFYFSVHTKSLKKTAAVFLFDPMVWDIFILSATVLVAMGNI